MSIKDLINYLPRCHQNVIKTLTDCPPPVFVFVCFNQIYCYSEIGQKYIAI